MLRCYEEEERGENLVKLVDESEVVPNRKYYMVDPIKPTVFYETMFSPEVEWQSILEFVQTNKIYIKHGDKRQECKTEGSHIRVTNQRLF